MAEFGRRKTILKKEEEKWQNLDAERKKYV